MKCPVCEKQIENTVQKCPNCGFEDLRTEFINENELEMWRTYVVYPCKFAYQTSIAQSKELERKFKKELSAIKKAQKETQESNGIAGGDAPTFKKPMLLKKDGWKTEKNVTYKLFYECAWGKWVKCEVSNLTLDFTGTKVTVNFLVKKTFDSNGDTSTETTRFKWRLKDDYGIVVADGSWANYHLCVGDVTKGSVSISGLDSSTQYTLEFINS